VSATRRARLATRRRAGFVLRIAERDGWMCWLCGLPVDPESPQHADESASLDHVEPLSQGGSNSIHNLRIAHRACNTLRGDGPAPITSTTEAARRDDRASPCLRAVPRERLLAP
jgi:5-methylcytosine-specific restriction endonuclease McrA